MQSDDYIGLTENEAKAQAAVDGYDVRVTARDGEYFIVTADYDPGRINFNIDHGLVMNAAMG